MKEDPELDAFEAVMDNLNREEFVEQVMQYIKEIAETGDAT